MKTGKLIKYLLIAFAVFIVFLIIGKKAGWFGQPDAIKVTAEEVQKRTIKEFITANGKVQPETEVKISPDVSGEITELYVKEGDYVEKGKLLLKIKPDVYVSIRDRVEAALNTARANLANARARLSQANAQFEKGKLDYERNEKLWGQKTISQAEWENARSLYLVAKADVEAAEQSVKSAEYNVESAKASLKEANENLQKTTIYAPMSGTISKLDVEKGERVVGTMQMAGTEILRIANLERMEVQVDVNENDIVKVSLHDTAIIEIDAYMDEEFKGIVTEIANSASTSGITTDQVTNFDVKILLLKNSYQHLIDEGKVTLFRPGMSATAEILTNTKFNVLSVPIQAVTTRSDTSKTARAPIKTDENEDVDGDADEDKEGKEEEEMFEVVFKVDVDKAKLVKVETGIQDNQYIEITSGLEEGEKVITAPYSAISKRLENGKLIEVKKEEELFEDK